MRKHIFKIMLILSLALAFSQFVSASTCLQELANESETCGALGTGSYTFSNNYTDNDYYTYANYFQGNITYKVPYGVNPSSSYYIYKAKPLFCQNEGELYPDVDNSTFNLSGCGSFTDTIVIKMIYESGDIDYVNYYCNDVLFDQIMTDGLMCMEVYRTARFFEEAMFWSYNELNGTIYDESTNNIVSENLTIRLIDNNILEYDIHESFDYDRGQDELEINFFNANYPKTIYYYLFGNDTYTDFYVLNDTSLTQNVEFTLTDKSQKLIENAKYTFWRRYNTSWKIVKQAKTDGVGKIQIHLDTTNNYRINITHPDYPTRNLNIIPFKTTYTLSIESESVSLYDNIGEGISWSITPSVWLINKTVDTDFTNISFYILSNDTDLEYYGIEITSTNLVCDPVSCTVQNTTSPSGGIVTLGIQSNISGRFEAHFFYKKEGKEIQYTNGRWGNIIQERTTTYSFIQSMKDLKTELGGNALISFTAIFLITTIVVLFSQLGVAGIALVLVVDFGIILFMSIGYIPIPIGIFDIIWGTIIYIFMRDNT